jgi:hypothetical protein
VAVELARLVLVSIPEIIQLLLVKLLMLEAVEETTSQTVPAKSVDREAVVALRGVAQRGPEVQVTKVTQAPIRVLAMEIPEEQDIGVAVTTEAEVAEQEQAGHQAMGLLLDILDSKMITKLAQTFITAAGAAGAHGAARLALVGMAEVVLEQ